MHLEVVGRLDATLELAPGKSVPPEKFVLAGTPEDVAKQTMALVTRRFPRRVRHAAGAHERGGLALLRDRVLPALWAGG
jgi:hypothetical protein